MAKKQEYTCVSYIRGADGALIPFSTLTEEQKQDVRSRIVANVNRTLSDYFTAHPEEIEPYSRGAGVKVIRET
ncbi:MAG: hypothetical protein IJ060_09300 [Oscillospiraceae bacterium]|nr:hypothetical protein [Oscillospiraceae bacterium]